MVEMKLALSELITSQVKISELKEQQESLIASAKTRLKWAAGSNPTLNEVRIFFFFFGFTNLNIFIFDFSIQVMNSFEDKIKTENENFTHNHQMAATIINMCTCVLHYESLRVQTPEAVLNDTNFVQVKKFGPV